jgi:uncharacterized OB-fold protein
VSDPAGRPVPVPDETSAPFWDAASEGRLVLARCSRCETFVHPPEPVCPHCHHTDPRFTFQAAPTTGVVRSWTVIRQSFLPGFDVPFVLVDAALDGLDDLRLIGRLLPPGSKASLHVGSAVQVVFEHRFGGGAVPAFALAHR